MTRASANTPSETRAASETVSTASETPESDAVAPAGYPDAFFRFIEDNIHSRPDRLRLTCHGKQADGFSYAEAIDQIEARRKSASRLSALTSNPRFIFPATICAEQATASSIARFHASLITPGQTLLDLTAGLGSDSFAFAAVAADVTSIERDPHFHRVLCHNIRTLGFTNITAINADCTRWLDTPDADRHFDVIYIDPHRRADDNSRTYDFNRCEPDITLLAPRLLMLAPKLIVKASPMLDIARAAANIPGTREIYVVSESRECKELLLVVEPGARFTRVVAVSASEDGFRTVAVDADAIGRVATTPLIEDTALLASGYLYEPDASMMKIRCWDWLSHRYAADGAQLRLLHPNTNLFHSTQLITDFPGRKFRIDGMIGTRDSRRLKGSSANTAVRNYPESADALARRLKLKPAGDAYIYGVRAGHAATPVLLSASLLP